MAYLQSLFILFTVSNSIVYLNTQYIGTPRRGDRLEAALRRTFNLKCEYNGGDDSGEFVEWFKRNATHDVSVNSDKPGHYVVKNTGKESNLLIKIFVTADAEVTKWYVRTNKLGNEEPTTCQFDQISLVPSPQGIEGNNGELLDTAHGSIRRTVGDSLVLNCLIQPENKYGNKIQWEFSKDDTTFGSLPSGIDLDGNEVRTDAVQKAHRGYYRCTLNSVSFTVLLRVKDKLAALWPFIGILCIVLVLVIIILIYEKRQKTNKKSNTTDEDEQDRASDPLVRTTTRSSDNDNRKRVVKA